MPPFPLCAVHYLCVRAGRIELLQRWPVDALNVAALVDSAITYRRWNGVEYRTEAAGAPLTGPQLVAI